MFKYLPRKIYSRWMKITRYEFWPAEILYTFGISYYLILCLINNRLGLLSAVNPGMQAKGVYLAPKFDTLKQITAKFPEHVPKSLALPTGKKAMWFKMTKDFIKRNKLKYPVVIKPQDGSRGTNVMLINNEKELKECLDMSPDNTLYMLQEHIQGIEYGVSYFRLPKEKHGNIFSLGYKELLYLQGNGSSTLEELIMRDNRAGIMYKVHLAKHADKLDWIPKKGERFKLVELGTHSRGAIFRDARHLINSKITHKIDMISQSYKGFYMGRYDLIAASERDLLAGKNFKIVELNSVMGEPMHLYEPGTPLLQGFSILFSYVRIAVNVAKENIELGFNPMPWYKFLSHTIGAYRQIFYKNEERVTKSS